MILKGVQIAWKQSPLLMFEMFIDRRGQKEKIIKFKWRSKTQKWTDQTRFRACDEFGDDCGRDILFLYITHAQYSKEWIPSSDVLKAPDGSSQDSESEDELSRQEQQKKYWGDPKLDTKQSTLTQHWEPNQCPNSGSGTGTSKSTTTSSDRTSSSGSSKRRRGKRGGRRRQLAKKRGDEDKRPPDRQQSNDCPTTPSHPDWIRRNCCSRNVYLAKICGNCGHPQTGL